MGRGVLERAPSRKQEVTWVAPIDDFLPLFTSINIVEAHLSLWQYEAKDQAL